MDKLRFSDKSVQLTIAPTMSCNFNCFYCFEPESEENLSMNDNVAESIISYINQIPGLEKLEVCWFGGEPLLEINRISTLTKRFKKLNIDYSATIVTNGYLLNDEFAEMIQELSIKSIQITIDGLEEEHDKRRPHKVTGKSFGHIMHNLDRLVKYLKRSNYALLISIRVNIDTLNTKRYREVYEYLTKKLDYKYLEVVPGWIRYVENRAVKSFCMQKNDVKKFILSNDEFNEVAEMLYPSNQYVNCFARTYWGLVIDPQGNCYKCWEDLGNEKLRVGNLESLNLLNSEVQQSYLYNTDVFACEECLNCSVLPICNNCPKDFLEENKDEKCVMYKAELPDFLCRYIVNQEL